MFKKIKNIFKKILIKYAFSLKSILIKNKNEIINEPVTKKKRGRPVGWRKNKDQSA